MFCTNTDFLANSLWNFLVDLSWNLYAFLNWYLFAFLLWDLLTNIDRVLSADCLRELSALLSMNIYWNILAPFIRKFFTFCSGNLSIHFFWNLLAVFFGHLEHKISDLAWTV